MLLSLAIQRLQGVAMEISAAPDLVLLALCDFDPVLRSSLTYLDDPEICFNRYRQSRMPVSENQHAVSKLQIATLLIKDIREKTIVHLLLRP